jgi:hypothetical protein
MAEVFAVVASVIAVIQITDRVVSLYIGYTNQEKIGVVACGPGGPCDEVCAAVVGLGDEKARFELEIDAYS